MTIQHTHNTDDTLCYGCFNFIQPKRGICFTTKFHKIKMLVDKSVGI